jgi:hypothetical protein
MAAAIRSAVLSCRKRAFPVWIRSRWRHSLAALVPKRLVSRRDNSLMLRSSSAF